MLSINAVKNANRRALPDTYTFEIYRNNNGLYVDKTEYMYNLVSSGLRLFFYSRPRRFGKSLTISTLKAIFQGKKELFKDLFIYDQPYEWKTYPIIHLDMGSIYAETPEDLNHALLISMLDNAEDNGIELQRTVASEAFSELIRKLYNRDKSPVVVLIDEYDKPILNNIENKNIDDLQKVMKAFYSVIKTCEAYERFVFITGVGKFFKVSIFSDLNNLNDISMTEDYSTMCGYTEQELEDNFHEKFAEIARKKGMEYLLLLEKVKNWYDGYKFSKYGVNVYNPVSLAKFIYNYGEFNNYWFETGSPSVLIKLFKNANIEIEKLLNEFQSENIFTAFLPSEVKLVPLMYQTGYLTIKETKSIGDRTKYRLGFPNFEVEESFYTRLLSGLSTDSTIGEEMSTKLYEAVEEDDLNSMMKIFDTYLAKIPYELHTKLEKYYQTIFYLIFKLIGANVKVEVHTSDGSIDAVIESNSKNYIFEFKLDKTEKIALDQIMKKEYYKAYEHASKQIVLVGANIDSETRRLAGWESKEL